MTYVNISSVTGVGIFFAILTIFIVAGRFESRRRWKNPTGIDDWLSIPAGVIVVAMGITMAVGAQHNIIGSHSPTQAGEAFLASEIERQILLEKYEFSLLLLHIVATSLIKLSILFFYRRIFRGHAGRTAFDICNWGLIIIQTGWLIAGFFATLFACGTHFFANWGSIADLKQYCFNTFWQNAALAIINFALDLAVLIVPLVIIWTLNMKRHEKIQASCVFLIAIFGVAAGCVRMVVWIKINLYVLGSGKPLLGLPSGNDDIGVVSILLFWNFIEIGVGMVVCCLPSHRRYIDVINKHTALYWQTSSLRTLFARSRDRSTTHSRGAAPHKPASDESLELVSTTHLASAGADKDRFGPHPGTTTTTTSFA